MLVHDVRDAFELRFGEVGVEGGYVAPQDREHRRRAAGDQPGQQARGGARRVGGAHRGGQGRGAHSLNETYNDGAMGWAGPQFALLLSTEAHYRKINGLFNRDLNNVAGGLQAPPGGRTDAWMAFLPSLSLVGQGRFSSNTSGFTSDPITGAIMVQANIPIYDGGTNYANLKETASKIEQEKLRLEQSESRIRSQVRGNVDDIALKQQALFKRLSVRPMVNLASGKNSTDIALAVESHEQR